MKKEQPLVSIIVPSYNSDQYIEKCLDSLLNQTYARTEIIVVDDGSTDRSASIIDEYSKKYNNIHVIHKTNGGLSSARNAGMKIANGKWFAFVDSDDYVSSNFVSRLLELAIKNDACIATCAFKAFSDYDVVLKESPTWPVAVLSGFEAIEDMFKNCRPAYICLSLFDAQLFKKNGLLFPEGREFEDMITRVKLLSYADNVVYSNQMLYNYLIRNDSITGADISKSRCEDFLLSLSDIREFLECRKNCGKVKYLSYYEYTSLTILLSYLAKRKNRSEWAKTYWSRIRKRLTQLYPKTFFPSRASRVKGGLLLALSLNMAVYSSLYNKRISKRKRTQK